MDISEIEDLIYKKEPNGICTLTISAPERRNAMTPVTFLEIETVLDDMERDKEAKVLVLTGSKEGRAFSSGGYFNPRSLKIRSRFKSRRFSRFRTSLDFSLSIS